MANQEQGAEMLARKDMTEIMGAEGWDIPVEEIQDPEMAAKASIFSALGLYLDFVNLFLYLIRFLGRRSN